MDDQQTQQGPVPADLDAWFAARPGLSSLRTAICDFNGCWRGKRLPREDLNKALSGALRMPLSLSALDIWGRDLVDSPLLRAGDADGVARPTGRAPVDMPWLSRPSALLPLWMYREDGSPSPYDPRHALDAVLRRAAAQGLFPVVGVEIEFYLVAALDAEPGPPVSPATGQVLSGDGIHSLAELDGFEAFFDDLYAAAEASGIAAEAAIAEGSAGQFEVILRHGSDVLKVADDVVLMKHLIRGIAQQHGIAASFMAKPYAAAAGNGLHCHVSLVDAAGRNVFDDGGARGSAPLHHAVAGALAAMPELTLVLAPHLNSYRRLRAGAHAPTHATWAYEDRFAALRIPGGPGAARRIEHRVAGADACPYLAVAAILGAMLEGIEAGVMPVEGASEALPDRWAAAIELFGGSAVARRIFGADFVEMYRAVKLQELGRFDEEVGAFEMRSYLGVV